MTRASPSSPRLIAIASGKGGVGKTWFAITLAHALARAGGRILLFDGDFGLANVDIQLGLLPGPDLSAVVAGTMCLADAIRACAPGGFDILPGRSGSGALAALPPATLERVLAGLATLGGRYEVVLLDLGAGLERGTRRLAAASDTLLVLATEEPASITDAYAVLKVNAADRAAHAATQGAAVGASADARVVVNQAASHAAGERTYATLAQACQTFLGARPALAGIIRQDAKVREAIRRQCLLLTRHPASEAGADVEAMAVALL
jgi:flagellar biosynthesis protein FlhG